MNTPTPTFSREFGRQDPQKTPGKPSKPDTRPVYYNPDDDEMIIHSGRVSIPNFANKCLCGYLSHFWWLFSRDVRSGTSRGLRLDGAVAKLVESHRTQ